MIITTFLRKLEEDREFKRVSALPEFHPKTSDPIEFVFNMDGKDYFKFSGEWDMPIDRWRFLQQFHDEMQMGVTKEVLVDFCKEINNAAGTGDLILVAKLVDNLSFRTESLFQPDSFIRFCTGYFFTLDEDVSTYDYVYNKKKTEVFKKKEYIFQLMKMFYDTQGSFYLKSKETLLAYLEVQRETITRNESIIKQRVEEVKRSKEQSKTQEK